MPEDIDMGGNPTGGQEITLEQAGEMAPPDNTPEVEITPQADTNPSTDPDARSNRPEIKVDDSNPDDNTIDFNDFLKAANKPLEKQDKKPEVKKDEPPKPEDKKPDEKPPVADDKKIDEKQPPPPSDKPVIGKDGRDYTGIEEADVPLFKKMGNESFAAIKPIYVENKKLKAETAANNEKFLNLEKEHKQLKERGPQFPDNYYEAEHGYMLDPTFQRSVGEFNLAQQILNHWTNQYQAIAEGAKEIEMIDMDKETGQLVVSSKIPANAGSEAKLLAYVTHAQNQLTQKQMKVQGFVETHKERHQAVVGAIQDMSQKFFHGFYATPEDKAIYEPLVQKRINNLPSSMRTGPSARFTAESLVMNEVLARMLNDAKAEIETLKKAGATTQPKNGNGSGNIPPTRRNPTLSDMGGGDGGKGGPPEVTVDDFEAVKRR